MKIKGWDKIQPQVKIGMYHYFSQLDTSPHHTSFGSIHRIGNGSDVSSWNTEISIQRKIPLGFIMQKN